MLRQTPAVGRTCGEFSPVGLRSTQTVRQFVRLSRNRRSQSPMNRLVAICCILMAGDVRAGSLPPAERITLLKEDFQVIQRNPDDRGACLVAVSPELAEPADCEFTVDDGKRVIRSGHVRPRDRTSWVKPCCSNRSRWEGRTPSRFPLRVRAAVERIPSGMYWSATSGSSAVNPTCSAST